MLRVNGEREGVAAVLHDVVEDSAVTLDDLAAEGFSQDVIEALAALTKQPGETRIDAARRAACNPIARTVKLADNAENTDLSRIALLTEKDRARLTEYAKVREVLLSAAP